MRNVLKQLKQYKRQTFLCIGLTALEVIMEILMPFVTAFIIDRGLEAGNLPVVYGLGAVMVVMAFLGLIFGALAGRNAAGAAAGLSANLREAIYSNIQTFSFSNIDKFSVPGLVTRMTTDITSVQENVTAIRVVKAFVREDYENVKFSRASKMLYDLSVKAEGLLAFNNPAMMIAIYFCIISVSWFGAQFIVSGSMTTGDLTSLFSYIMSLLMSLMMLSMIVVMISMSLASIRRISEVLDEVPDLKDPADPVMEVKDGQIDFNHVKKCFVRH